MPTSKSTSKKPKEENDSESEEFNLATKKSKRDDGVKSKDHMALKIVTLFYMYMALRMQIPHHLVRLKGLLLTSWLNTAFVIDVSKKLLIRRFDSSCLYTRSGLSLKSIFLLNCLYTYKILNP